MHEVQDRLQLISNYYAATSCTELAERAGCDIQTVVLRAAGANIEFEFLLGLKQNVHRLGLDNKME